MSSLTLTVPARRPVMARVIFGDRADAAWARPALWLLLAATGLLYLWNLSNSGYANSFYAAAVQAGSTDWTAWFFGSLDTSNFITVDKPPASLWVMGLSARIFGFSSWSLLLPQALMGVASVALVFGIVRRSLSTYGPRLSAAGGLLGGFVLAATPAAALMFRFDNPDAMLVLLMTAAAYCAVRARPKASWQWLALAGVALGFAFLTKMLEGLLVLPGIALAYLLFANTTVVKRLVHLAIAAAALVVSAGWWVVVVALWPSSARPYIGGSTNNSVLDLVFGYNGFGRIFGSSSGAGGGGSDSETGLTRLFSGEMGLEISWLLPAALIALVLGLVVARSRVVRASLVMWSGWLFVTGLVFSYMSGTIHPYYTVALAPAIAGLIATGGIVLWHARARWVGSIGLAAMIFAAGVWGFVLLSEDMTFMPGVRFVVIGIALLASVLVVAASALSLRRLATVMLVLGTVAGLAGPVAYSMATASVGHTGSIPSVGASSSSGQGSSSTLDELSALLATSDARWAAAITGSSAAATVELGTGTAVMAIGGWRDDPTPTLEEFQAYVAAGDVGFYIASDSQGGGRSNSSTGSEISEWVAANYSPTTVDGYTVYDLAG